jgi:phosphopantothenoylcysteine decarboxylase/phosphopantothenate--cysteine ligase
MEEPEKIVDAIEEWFISEQNAEYKLLQGKKVLITAGPTYENIDPVRFIGNYSSGKMGFALAQAAAEKGAEVVLVAGPVSLPTPKGNVNRINVTSANEMLAKCLENFDSCDVAILCAAVADYAPAEVAEKKIKREGVDEMTLRLVRNPDIAATLGSRKGNKMLIGFALETDNGRENAYGKLQRKNLDAIVLNSLTDPEAGFGKDTNKVTIISKNGEKSLPVGLKKDVAKGIINELLG